MAEPLTHELVVRALLRARARYQRIEERERRRIWRQILARELTAPLAADGSAYHLRSLARKRRSR